MTQKKTTSEVFENNTTMHGLKFATRKPAFLHGNNQNVIDWNVEVIYRINDQKIPTLFKVSTKSNGYLQLSVNSELWHFCFYHPQKSDKDFGLYAWYLIHCPWQSVKDKLYTQSHYNAQGFNTKRRGKKQSNKILSCRAEVQLYGKAIEGMYC